MNSPLKEVSFSEEMLEYARKGSAVVSHKESLKTHLLETRNQEGAAFDREGEESLVYTAYNFGISEALDFDYDRNQAADYLRSYGKGERLDLLSLSGLCRAWNWLSTDVPEVGLSRGISKNIELYRCHDLGYSQVYGARASTVYASFLGFGAYQDLELTLPDEIKYIKSLNDYCHEGFFSNETAGNSSALATAHGTALLRALEEPVKAETVKVLEDFSCEGGGFKALAQMPIADVLSTASVLWQLKEMGLEIKNRDAHRQFILSLQDSETGGFYGHAHDDKIDSEFTFHAIMALGLLED